MASTPAIISGGGGFDLSISPLMYPLRRGLHRLARAARARAAPSRCRSCSRSALAIGALNGLLIILLRVPPVVVTLSMYFILIGVDLRVAPKPEVPERRAGSTTSPGRSGPIPGRAVHRSASRSLVWVAARADARTGARSTPSAATTRRRSRAASTSRSCASIAYALGGLFAAVGGLALIALDELGEPEPRRRPTRCWRSPSVALGGTSLWGGRGGLFGSLLGAASIYLLGNLLITLAGRPELPPGHVRRRCSSSRSSSAASPARAKAVGMTRGRRPQPTHAASAPAWAQARQPAGARSRPAARRARSLVFAYGAIDLGLLELGQRQADPRARVARRARLGRARRC